MTSPQYDLGTAWLLFLGSEWPMAIEQQIWRCGDDENPLDLFEDMHRNDIVFDRT